MGSHSPPEVVAQVRALAVAGRSQNFISRQTGIPLTTVHRWIHEWNDLETEQGRAMVTAEYRIGRLLDTMVTEQIEAILEDDRKNWPSLRDLMVSWGISRSKIHERATRNQAPLNIGVYVFTQTPQLQNQALSTQTAHDTEQATHEIAQSSNEIALTGDYREIKDPT